MVLFGRRQERLDSAKAALGHAASTVQGDICNTDDIERLVTHAQELGGMIDILVNNAGLFEGAPFEDLSEADWDRTMNVNLRGVFLLTQKVVRTMIKQDSGSLIHISSVLGTKAFGGTLAYSVSKAALNHFSACLAVEYGGRGIRSNVISPGLIETEMTEELRSNQEFVDNLLQCYPLGRIGVPEDVAKVCLFLASDQSAYLTGANLPVDGGYLAT